MTMTEGAIEPGAEAGTSEPENAEMPNAAAPHVEELSHDDAVAHLRARQNFGLAIAAGLGAAVVGAIFWAGFVYATEYKLGLIAVAVGALVGIAVRKAGNGIDPKFGILGAVCAAFGWALGTILCDVAFLAKDAGRPFLDVLASLGVGESISLGLRAADAMDLLFFAIAVWEGYKFSFRYRVR
jgi:hypothetical protein